MIKYISIARYQFASDWISVKFKSIRDVQLKKWLLLIDKPEPNISDEERPFLNLILVVIW